MLVLIAEVRTRAFLASLVPVIVNSVLNEHQLVLDIVAFVAMGDFPRSRLGEKQRGKILASWVSRKMRTIAQFSIRDPDAEGSVGTAVPEEAMGRRGSAQSGRAGAGSMRRGIGTGASSLRHAESLSQMPVMEEPPMPQDHLTLQTDQYSQSLHPPGTHEDSRNDDTPTNETPRPLQLNTTLDYSPVQPVELDTPANFSSQQPQQTHDQMQASPADDLSSFDYHPGFTAAGSEAQAPQAYHQPQQQHPTYSPYDDDSPSDVPRPLNGGGGGGLRVANRASASSEEDWGAEALRHMKLGD